MIVDSHCHLSYKNNLENIDEIIHAADIAGVKKFLNISTNFKDFENLINISKKYTNIYFTLGVHPHEADQTTEEIIYEIKRNVDNPKLLAIGETGLDFYYNHSDKENQIRSLEMHIELSQETQLPLVIHMRDAEEEILSIFKKKIINKNFTGVIHCFTGSQNFANKMLELDFYISASGIITFKKSEELRNIFKTIPDDRLLVETDSPYLSPEPLRGKINQPSHIIHTLRVLADIRNDDYDKLCLKTANNFDNLFHKRK